jgi:pimeloyl-ACP methyl ester carboxylesterase
MRVATPTGAIEVERGGEGPGVPVLLLHGLGVNRSSWRAQLDHLWKARRAAAFDSLGCGESDPPSDDVYTVPARADAVGQVADALGWNRFVLVGASYGGLVAGAYAAREPRRVAGVVLADGALDPATWPPGQADAVAGLMRSDWDEAIARGLVPQLALASETVRAAVCAAVDATPRRTVIEGYANLKGWDARATLSRYPGPKLSVAARSLDEPGAVHHTLPCPVRFMDGVSHVLMMDAPEEFNRILDAFVAEL